MSMQIETTAKRKRGAWLRTGLGAALAILIPTVAVAALEIPNAFEAGQVVSAADMNENFQAVADAINARRGVFVDLGVSLTPAVTTRVLQARAPGTFLVRPQGDGLGSIDISATLGDGYSGGDVTCTGGCTPGPRMLNGSSLVLELGTGDVIRLTFAGSGASSAAGVKWRPAGSDATPPLVLE